MKKIVLALSIILLLTGCSCSISSNTPTMKAEEFLNRYKTLNESVISDLELSSEVTGLSTTEQKTKYVDVMKRQYQDMDFEVTNEEVNGDEAQVEVKISVYDIYKARSEASAYTTDNPSEFYVSDTDMTSDTLKVNDYILGKLHTTDERVDYTITINLIKEDGNWKVVELDSETKEKIHGTYNYENE